MNILFHIDVECVPENGGIERVTSLIGTELMRRGHHVYASYRIPVARKAPRPKFDAHFRLEANASEHLAKIICEKEIDVIVVQKTFRDLPWIRKAAQMSGRDVKIIYCLHKSPSRTEGWAGVKGLVFNDYSRANIFKIPLKLLLHPIRKREYDTQQYKWPARYADHILVLSKQYIGPWLEIAEGEGKGIISAIPNPLSFNPETTEQSIIRKKKKVLIVARMHERQKNLTEALRIWKKIMEYPDLRDWSLEIVGDGPNRAKVEKAAERLAVENVNFHGYQDPRRYFEEASIFMMTSRFEGWPMTINEAMQYGCVPIVYSSFSAIYDVIAPGIDGCLVEPFNTDEYVKTMLGLMRSEKRRHAMALAAVEGSRRFELEPIADRWEEVIKL